MADGSCQPQPGDLIEIDRPFHQHWALYIGDGYVINLTPADEGAPSLSVSSDTLFTRKSKVKKELLKEVVGNDAWAVNNKYDCHCTPLPLEMIIQCAESCIGKEMEYDMFKIECDYFVRKLRYGEEPWAFVGGEMHIPDMRDDEKYPKPGDLIEIKQEYNDHWALYLGHGYVIHVAPIDGNSSRLSLSVSSTTANVMVKKQLLKDVAEKDSWAVNNKHDQYRNPFPVEEIIRRAEGLLNKELKYSVVFKNCEHFVTKLRYGEAVSLQVLVALVSGHQISSVPFSLGFAALSIIPAVVLSAVTVLSFLATAYNCKHICDKFRTAGRDILKERCC